MIINEMNPGFVFFVGEELFVGFVEGFGFFVDGGDVCFDVSIFVGEESLHFFVVGECVEKDDAPSFVCL